MTSRPITAEQAREALPALLYAKVLCGKVSFFTSGVDEDKKQLAFAFEKAARALGYDIAPKEEE